MHFCLIQLPEIHINYNLEKKKKIIKKISEIVLNEKKGGNQKV